ncbi:sensor histidine kinase [Desertivirga arenae]|uniref:sensor histidine kinase n=1 Tax=Desertivirga arenae TaxID=2810309 RepID=UPI001F603408|nr:ATP-binding protein [Pedobacter sp. SYSU D00823]
MLRDTNSSYIENMIGEIEDYAILFLDTEGIIRTWNKGAEKVKGYQSEEVIGKHFRLFYSTNDRENQKPENLISTAQKEGKAIDEGWRIKKNGDRFWASVSITAIHNESLELIGFTKVTRDLTERMLAEVSLRQYSNQLKFKNSELEQFVYIASHDLQEPLQTVINFIELFNAEYTEALDENAALYLRFIESASLRMRALIKSLLDYSRIGMAKEAEKVDLDKVAGSVLLDLNSQVQEKNASVNIESLPVVYGYSVELRQLLQNLINNAIKFSKPGIEPVINISSERLPNEWRIKVSDNGIGIQKQHFHKIFMIFQRLHSREEYEGNGIGLANCKKIVELHKGVLEVESTPGLGSTFYFNIPDQVN